jgi:hypothetical protein
MKPNLSRKLSLPINWDKLLIGSVISIGLLFVFGLLFKIRVFVALAEISAVATLFLTLFIFFVSIVRKYASKNNQSK